MDSKDKYSERFDDLNPLTLIKGSRVSGVGPRVLKDDFGRCVSHRRGEIAALEERDVEAQVEHVFETIVNVDPPIMPDMVMSSPVRQHVIQSAEDEKLELTGICQSILARRCGIPDCMKNAARSTIQRSWRRHSTMSQDPN